MAVPSDSSPRPNFLFNSTDQQRWDAMGFLKQRSPAGALRDARLIEQLY